MFIKNHAKFTATMGKGFKVGETDVEIKLMLPLIVVQENCMFLSTNHGEKINVIFGDPQASMAFDEDNEDMYRVYTGRRVTADASGIVTNVESQGEDPNQADLLTEIQEEESNPAAEGDNPEVDGSVGEGTDPDAPAKEDPEGGESEGEVEPGTDDSSDLPDWMQEGNSPTGDQEMDFGDPIGSNGEEKHEDGSQSQDSGEQDGSSEDPSAVAEIDNEVVEEFILEKRPTFPDITLDFPNLLKQRREQGETWMKIATTVGITSGQLSTQWKKYKDRVKGLIRDGGAA